jgi:tRNA/rRNA methyltransferase
MDRPDDLSRIRVVLSKPSHPGNIGAAARAMKTMGFADLALVQPRYFPDPDATAMAAGAADLLSRAGVHATLEAALGDCVLAVGFSSRARDLSHPALPLREAAREILDAAQTGRVALVFGNETSGLSNEELSRCQRLVAIPANAEYASLNLAAAVQVACYELATTGAAHATPAAGAGTAATGEDLRAFFEHLETAVTASGYVDPQKPGRFMERMRRLFARTGLEREEVKLLQGMLAQVEKRMRRD